MRLVPVETKRKREIDPIYSNLILLAWLSLDGPPPLPKIRHSKRGWYQYPCTSTR